MLAGLMPSAGPIIISSGHDPEKSLPALDGCGPVFARDKREAFCAAIMLKQSIERDDDSKKSHAPLICIDFEVAPCCGASPFAYSLSP
jgi:hypothetical protein